MIGSVGGWVAGRPPQARMTRPGWDHARRSAPDGDRVFARGCGPLAHRTGGTLDRGKDGREFAGPEIREEPDQGVDDAQQGQPDSRQEHPVDPTLVPPRGDALAQLAEGALQAVVGGRRGLVGHLVSIEVVSEVT